MSSEVNPFISLDIAEGGQAALDVANGGQDNAESTMFTTRVATKDNDDRLATSTAPASPSDGTRSIESSSEGSGSSSGRSAHPRAANQLRDPNRYQVLGEHGRGGLGRVSRAHDLELGRDVAIKELIARGNVNEARFLREALITARLEHPSIVPVHEAGHWPDGTPFYAMKLVAGRPLRDLIAERTTVEERIGLLHHVIAVADAIAYAHGRNIIHRDLKPGNVIVGDFGETVVIDWGIAKDLTATEEPSIGGGSPRGNLDHELTVAGSILGTPGYMAPEQRRGENVDQRADVFAIGAMLWELCSLDSSPPSDPRHYHRLLRRAGVDKDLITIIAKALDPDPERRYPDAGALAVDLKAFKSGARIAARSYSLFAMLVHWTRHHRALAVSAAVAALLAFAGVAFYVQSVAIERDRADASERTAMRERASSVASLDELTLNHAQLLLTTDPSAAIDALATYHGANADRANQIRAEATGRGVALLRAMPHSANVRWIEATSDGAIFSLSSDGTIAQTTRDGISVILSHNVDRAGQVAYSRTRHLLAYTCDPSDLCIYDIIHRSQVAVAPLFRDARAQGISFSSDGMLLALMSRDSVLRVFNLADPALPRLRIAKTIHGGADVVFFRDDIVLAGSESGVEFVHMDGASEPFSIPDNSYWDVNVSEHRFALATIRGQGFLFEGSPIQITKRIDLCHGRVIGLQFIAGRQGIAYGCKEGTIGIWDYAHDVATPRAHIEGHADLIAVSAAGDYIAAGGGNGTISVLDLDTGLTTFLRGHEFRLTVIAPPSSEHLFLISADAMGAVRAWPLPPRYAAVKTTLNSPLHTAIFDRQSSTVIATSFLSVLTTFSRSSGIRTIGPHEPDNIYIERSGNNRIFATYGFNDLVELWSSATLTRIKIFNTKHGSIRQLSFVGSDDEIVTSGNDGRLVRWSPSGIGTLLAQINRPIDLFAIVPANGSIVFSSVDGALWSIGADGRTTMLRPAGSTVTRLLTVPGQRTVVVGYNNGEVVTIDTKSGERHVALRARGSVRAISVTADGHWMAVATDDGTIHVGAPHISGANPQAMTWTKLAVHARQQALTSNGELVILGADGTIRVYSILDRHWLCLPTGTVDLRWIAISPKEDAAVIVDVEGRLLWLDLNSVRRSYQNNATK